MTCVDCGLNAEPCEQYKTCGCSTADDGHCRDCLHQADCHPERPEEEKR